MLKMEQSVGEIGGGGGRRKLHIEKNQEKFT